MQQRTATWRRSRRSLALVAAIGGVVVAGTGCGDSSNTAPLVATSITVGSGSNAQTGVVGQALASPITVVVLDQKGDPIANAAVTWTVSSSQGTVSAASTTTDANGSTSVTWTLGTVAGVDSLVASIASGGDDDDHRYRCRGGAQVPVGRQR